MKTSLSVVTLLILTLSTAVNATLPTPSDSSIPGDPEDNDKVIQSMREAHTLDPALQKRFQHTYCFVPLSEMPGLPPDIKEILEATTLVRASLQKESSPVLSGETAKGKGAPAYQSIPIVPSIRADQILSTTLNTNGVNRELLREGIPFLTFNGHYVERAVIKPIHGSPISIRSRESYLTYFGAPGYGKTFVVTLAKLGIPEAGSVLSFGEGTPPILSGSILEYSFVSDGIELSKPGSALKESAELKVEDIESIEFFGKGGYFHLIHRLKKLLPGQKP